MFKEAQKVLDSLASRISNLENYEDDHPTRRFVEKMANSLKVY